MIGSYGTRSSITQSLSKSECFLRQWRQFCSGRSYSIEHFFPCNKGRYCPRYRYASRRSAQLVPTIPLFHLLNTNRWVSNKHPFNAYVQFYLYKFFVNYVVKIKYLIDKATPIENKNTMLDNVTEFWSYVPRTVNKSSLLKYFLFYINSWFLSECSSKLQKALVVLGDIGNNDIDYALNQNKTIQEITSYVPLISEAIANATRVNEFLRYNYICLI